MQGGEIAQQRPPPPGADQPYPNLATVPAKPEAPDRRRWRRSPGPGRRPRACRVSRRGGAAGRPVLALRVARAVRARAPCRHRRRRPAPTAAGGAAASASPAGAASAPPLPRRASAAAGGGAAPPPNAPAASPPCTSAPLGAAARADRPMPLRPGRARAVGQRAAASRRHPPPTAAAAPRKLRRRAQLPRHRRSAAAAECAAGAARLAAAAAAVRPPPSLPPRRRRRPVAGPGAPWRSPCRRRAADRGTAASANATAVEFVGRFRHVADRRGRLAKDVAAKRGERGDRRHRLWRGDVRRSGRCSRRR